KSYSVLALGLIAVQAQDPSQAQAACRRISNRCTNAHQNQQNDVSGAFNRACRIIDRNWRAISRCELTRATCALTWENCQTLSCANVRRALGGGGSHPSPRTTTRRTPTPRTTRRGPTPRTTRRGPTPRTTRRGPTPRTTRRNPSPQTTRRGPTPRTTRRNPTPR
ncbi:hypothetical protein KR067_003651, partial [Drosophila pandora]